MVLKSTKKNQSAHSNSNHVNHCSGKQTAQRNKDEPANKETDYPRPKSNTPKQPTKNKFQKPYETIT